MSTVSTPISSPADSPIQALHGQQATIQIPQAPLGNANSAMNAQPGTGTKALLAKKLAKGTKAGKFHSPTDNMLTPCSKKLNQVKRKHFTKGKPIEKLFTAGSFSTTDPDSTSPDKEVVDAELPKTEEEEEESKMDEDLPEPIDPEADKENEENPFKA